MLESTNVVSISFSSHGPFSFTTAEKDGGMIPGAKHIHFKDLFSKEDGTIKEDDELRKCKKFFYFLHTVFTLNTLLVNILKFRIVHSVFFWPKFCFLCSCFIKYFGADGRFDQCLVRQHSFVKIDREIFFKVVHNYWLTT